ncbi:PEP-CTERM sorting domain-containing protein [Pseudorhodoferax sp. Leaf265]|uniref:PEP-CTERM sorting domain-containing protein n=1 Tax=Pseudorhodoferax sp. Leaf265 TaxID=1736315 RepID=UPI0006FD8628|nr:PEP-CTERM sorting domain-containing protein [Pseudorhodoferax sp. Leaf265]KQP15935.1 glycosyl transferase family 1 [Pseudorhodoferax sp. Leaf265]
MRHGSLFPSSRLWRGAAQAALALSLGAAGAGAWAAPSILFIGNSFTYGQGSAVQTYMPNTVTDLNGTNVGGIPALFKAFTQQAGLSYDVSLETVGGSGLDLHYNTKQALIDKPWDNVVMHTFSTLDAANPGDPTKLLQYSSLLADMFVAQNADVNVQLMATWSRADQTYPVGRHWYGQSIYQMALDVYAGYALADAASDNIHGVIPVGLAWNMAMAEGFADLNPYDGIAPGLVNLWASDSYHASQYGSYLEALVVFGQVTGLDPRSLGSSETAAAALGITGAQARTMQELAYRQLASSEVPEPASALLVLSGGLAMLWLRRRPR